MKAVPRRLAMDDVRRMFQELPGVEEGPCYGTLGFRVRGKLLARFWEDGETLVVKCGDEERDVRLAERPQVYFMTPHYDGYPAVLVRLRKVGRTELRALLESSWRRAAPKKLLAQLDGR
jgi:hypothetical protein